jgi:hypothetical protein
MVPNGTQQWYKTKLVQILKTSCLTRTLHNIRPYINNCTNYNFYHKLQQTYKTEIIQQSCIQNKIYWFSSFLGLHLRIDIVCPSYGWVSHIVHLVSYGWISNTQHHTRHKRYCHPEHTRMHRIHGVDSYRCET